MGRVPRVEETGRRAGGRAGGGDLDSDDTDLAHAGGDHLTLTAFEHLYGAEKVSVEPDRANRFSLSLKHGTGTREIGGWSGTGFVIRHIFWGLGIGEVLCLYLCLCLFQPQPPSISA